MLPPRRARSCSLGSEEQAALRESLLQNELLVRADGSGASLGGSPRHINVGSFVGTRSLLRGGSGHGSRHGAIGQPVRGGWGSPSRVWATDVMSTPTPPGRYLGSVAVRLHRLNAAELEYVRDQCVAALHTLQGELSGPMTGDDRRGPWDGQMSLHGAMAGDNRWGGGWGRSPTAMGLPNGPPGAHHTIARFASAYLKCRGCQCVYYVGQLTGEQLCYGCDGYNRGTSGSARRRSRTAGH